MKPLLHSDKGFSVPGLLVAAAVVGIMSAAIGSIMVTFQKRLSFGQATTIKQNNVTALTTALSNTIACQNNFTFAGGGAVTLPDNNTPNQPDGTVAMQVSDRRLYQYSPSGTVAGVVIPLDNEQLDGNRFLEVEGKWLTNINNTDTTADNFYTANLEIRFKTVPGYPATSPLVIKGLRFTAASRVVTTCDVGEKVFYCASFRYYQPSGSVTQLNSNPPRTWNPSEVTRIISGGGLEGLECRSSPTPWNMTSCAMNVPGTPNPETVGLNSFGANKCMSRVGGPDYFTISCCANM